jgi:hypothetical protein
VHARRGRTPHTAAAAVRGASARPAFDANALPVDRIGQHPAIQQQHIGLIDLEELLKEPQDRADLLRRQLAVPGRLLADRGDRNLLPASVENLGPIGAVDRRPNLKRLVQIAEHLLEADLVVQIQFCRAKRLALEALRRQPLKNIQRGD